MRAGELRERVTIQQNTPTRDGFDAAIEHWSTFATLWAKVETVSGTETIDQQRAAALLTYNITLRYYPGITPDMRVSWRGSLLNINAIIDDRAGGDMKLVCSEVVNA